MSGILYVLAALLLLGIMISIHEAGHFFAARACGIAVKAFSIGFGPKIWGRTGKNGTVYTLRAIPCGGFCAFYGEDDVSGKADSDPRALTRQAAWKRLVTIAAGPIMNFVLAFVAALCFFGVQGLPYAGEGLEAQVISVTADSPAEKGGLKPGDVILKTGGTEIKDTESLFPGYSAEKGAVALEVRRDGKVLQLQVTPDYISTENRYMVGVTIQYAYPIQWMHADFAATLRHSWNVCVDAAGAVLTTLKNLVSTGEGADQISGPVGAVSVIAQQTAEYSLIGYIEMMIVLSINLGLMNLLPIPGLDGSRIWFVAFEMIFRRPVNRKVEAWIHTIGMLLLMVLMLFLTFRDILNLF